MPCLEQKDPFMSIPSSGTFIQPLWRPPYDPKIVTQIKLFLLLGLCLQVSATVLTDGEKTLLSIVPCLLGFYYINVMLLSSFLLRGFGGIFVSRFQGWRPGGYCWWPLLGRSQRRHCSFDGCGRRSPMPTALPPALFRLGLNIPPPAGLLGLMLVITARSRCQQTGLVGEWHGAGRIGRPF